MPYEINHLAPVLFGEGAAEETGARLKGFGCKSVLCVFDKGIKNAGVAGRIMDNIKAQGIKVTEFDGVQADPPDTVIEAAAEIGRKAGIDGIVGIGGGSTMDTAKGINVLINNPPPVVKYMGSDEKLKPGVALVLLPTTSGTGSEVTPIAVVTNTSTHRKGGILGPLCRATLSIVDPALTVGMPPSITADTGMDALSHAAEAMTSGFANQMSDVLAYEAVRLIALYLPRAVENGKDMEARSQMAFAAMTAGYAFADALPHYGHAIGHTLGAMYHVPHGNACGIALPAVMEYISDVVPERVKSIGQAMGVKFGPNDSEPEIGAKVADAIRDLGKKIGMRTLRDHNIQESAFNEIAEMTLTDDTAGFGPKKASKEDVLRMLSDSYLH